MTYDYAAEAKREREEFEAAVRRLTPAQQRKWEREMEACEWFDGEDGIAHGHLNAMLRRGEL